MDLKLIKQVVELMERSEIAELEFEEEGLKLRLSRQSKDAPAQIIQTAPIPAAPVATAAETPPAAAPTAPVEEAGISVIKSPMVGTFYSSPSPDSPSFVDVGGKVKADSIVCIIEAMKVMNEIQAEIAGTITEVLVENGDAIEYGQPLYKVKTA